MDVLIHKFNTDYFCTDPLTKPIVSNWDSPKHTILTPMEKHNTKNMFKQTYTSQGIYTDNTTRTVDLLRKLDFPNPSKKKLFKNT